MKKSQELRARAEVISELENELDRAERAYKQAVEECFDNLDELSFKVELWKQAIKSLDR